MVGLVTSYRKSVHQIEQLQKLAVLEPERQVDVSKSRAHLARQLRPADIGELIQKYQAGESMNALARLYKLHRTTVAGHLQKAGITPRNVTISDKQVSRAVELYESGLSLAAVGKKLGFNDTTIHTHLKRRGVQMRSANRTRR
jgi:AraC-like DNA-binding protein